jgi:hypothetical protein
VRIYRSIKQNSVLCRFVTTKFSSLVEYAGKSNAAVTRADCTCKWEKCTCVHVHHLKLSMTFESQHWNSLHTSGIVLGKRIKVAHSSLRKMLSNNKTFKVHVEADGVTYHRLWNHHCSLRGNNVHGFCGSPLPTNLHPYEHAFISFHIYINIARSHHLLHFQLWNTVIYPFNKICYLHNLLFSQWK